MFASDGVNAWWIQLHELADSTLKSSWRLTHVGRISVNKCYAVSSILHPPIYISYILSYILHITKEAIKQHLCSLIHPPLTVDGSEILHQLRLVVDYPTIYEGFCTLQPVVLLGFLNHQQVSIGYPSIHPSLHPSLPPKTKKTHPSRKPKR